MLHAEQEADLSKQKKKSHESITCGCKSRVGCPHQPDHANAIATGVWNEGQPDSPSANTPDAATAALGEIIQPESSQKSPGKDKNSLLSTLVNAGMNTPSSKKRRFDTGSPDCQADLCPQHRGRDGSSSPELESVEGRNTSVTQSQGGLRGSKRLRLDFNTGGGQEDDMITDTVGCIAIDQHGHIAAGSSSGGIGMKHRGRIGPAALVGIGTAVVPESPNDEFGTVTASIMSGTGEHFATTMAAQRAAERIYHGTRQGPHGEDVYDDDDDAVMKSFVLNDFFRHPGVAGMSSGLAAAIGTVTVKKCKDGIYFMFAHNTDSFALASMFSTDKEPLCLMSRLNKTSKAYDGCATGGRGISIKS
jgi:taspase (threonine aspartase 1)